MRRILAAALALVLGTYALRLQKCGGKERGGANRANRRRDAGERGGH